MSAIVFRPGKSKIWHYRYQVYGERVQRSTRLTSKPKAEELANKAYSAAVTRANGGEPVPTLRQLFEEWLPLHKPVVSNSHYKGVETVLRLHLYEIGEIPVNDLSTLDIQHARNSHLIDHKPASANQWLRVIKLICKWAVKRKIIVTLPWLVVMLKVQKKPRPILPVAVVMAWLKEIDAATLRSPNVATAIRMMFGVGARESESATARWEWIDWERRTYTPGITKGREADPVPMPEWLVEYLEPRRRDAGLIAPARDGGELPAGFSRAPIRMANTKCKTRGITAHRLRGSFATLLSEAGAPVQDIQAVMRHKSVLTTMTYLEKNMGRAEKAQQKIGQKIGFVRRESGATLESEPYAD